MQIARSRSATNLCWQSDRPRLGRLLSLSLWRDRCRRQSSDPARARRRCRDELIHRHTDDQKPSRASCRLDSRAPHIDPPPTRPAPGPLLINLLFAKMTSASSPPHNLIQRVFAPNLTDAPLVGLLCGYFIRSVTISTRLTTARRKASSCTRRRLRIRPRRKLFLC